MGAIKNHYHDEICNQESDPRADMPTEEEYLEAQKQWWQQMNDDEQYIAEQEEKTCQ